MTGIEQSWPIPTPILIPFRHSSTCPHSQYHISLTEQPDKEGHRRPQIDRLSFALRRNPRVNNDTKAPIGCSRPGQWNSYPASRKLSGKHPIRLPGSLRVRLEDNRPCLVFEKNSGRQPTFRLVEEVNGHSRDTLPTTGRCSCLRIAWEPNNKQGIFGPSMFNVHISITVPKPSASNAHAIQSIDSRFNNDQWLVWSPSIPLAQPAVVTQGSVVTQG